ncbi:MAG: hypothetical protein HOH26_04125 [Alphaproteobacteria bacterium]|nr:hypothetical protein [Alphaproteobacteria bacterium]
MTAISIAPGGAGESIDGYADYARAMKARGQTAANQTKPDIPEGTESMAWGKDGFTFGDVLDIINPLQHIPIISDIYRAATGDEIAPAARMLGGGILGGIPGLAVAAVNTVIEEVTGQDVGEIAMASLFGGNGAADPLPDTAPIVAPETAIANNLPNTAAPMAVAAAKPIGLQFSSVAKPVTDSGAAAGTSTPDGQAQALTNSGGINFFNMNEMSPRVANNTAHPGAIQNSFFKPGANPEQAIAASFAQPNAAAGSTPTPALTNLALVNQEAGQVQQAPRPEVYSRPASMAVNENGLSPAQQNDANRAALLAAARDLRAAFQSHSTFKTDDRLKELQASQAK